MLVEGLPSTSAWVLTPALYKSLMAPACNPSTAEVRRPEVQGHPWLYSKLEASVAQTCGNVNENRKEKHFHDYVAYCHADLKRKLLWLRRLGSQALRGLAWPG